MRTAVVLIAMISCSTTSTRGYYIEKGALRAPQSPRDRRGTTAGDKLVIVFTHSDTPPGCASERMRQTDISVELPSRPTGQTRVDLSTTRVVFEYGGQIVTFASESCRGELVVTPAGDELDASIDVTCDQPKTGTGNRSFAGSTRLRRSSL